MDMASDFNFSQDTFQEELFPPGVLPKELLVISNYSWAIIVMASIVFLGGSCGNLYVVVCLKKILRLRYSSMHHLLLHMCYTELLVVFITIPLDIAWRVMIGWYAGNFACKIANFLRCMIYFLSSLVLICMSIDCFCNVFFPRKFSNNARKRVRWMIIVSWGVAFVSAAPKFFLSHVRGHPEFTSFKQCLIENAPAFFSIYPLVESYFAPLIVVLMTYTPTFFRVCGQFQNAASKKVDDNPSETTTDNLKIEGVKLTFAFALVVIICYTPQILLILLHYICPSINSSNREETVLYFLETSKSVAMPVVYRLFRSNLNSALLELNHLEYY